MRHFSIVLTSGLRIASGSGSSTRSGVRETLSLALFAPKGDGKTYLNEREATPEEIETIRKEINDFLDQMVRPQSPKGG